MHDTITVSKNQFDELVKSMKRIEHLLARLVQTREGNTRMAEDEIRRIKETYVYEEGEPEYGTAAWWEWAEQQSATAIAQGEYVTLKTKEELQHYLDSLKQDDH